jgi:ribosomal protein S18 acetylase RimI-like enzyme
MKDVKIRMVQRSDQPFIKGLVKELYETLDVKDGMDEVLTDAKFHEILVDATTEVLVAELDGIVVGYLTLNLTKTFLDAGMSTIIGELVVSSNYRRQGIGKKMVIAAIARCKKLGCSEIGVGTETKNAKARAFYESCGFSERGIIFDLELSNEN